MTAVLRRIHGSDRNRATRRRLTAAATVRLWAELMCNIRWADIYIILLSTYHPSRWAGRERNGMADDIIGNGIDKKEGDSGRAGNGGKGRNGKMKGKGRGEGKEWK